jgi:hypothetical protein
LSLASRAVLGERRAVVPGGFLLDHFLTLMLVDVLVLVETAGGGFPDGIGACFGADGK